MLPARCGPTTVPGLRDTPGNALPKSPSRRSTSAPVTVWRFFDAATAFPDESATGLTPYDKFFLTSYPGSGGWDTETIYQPTNYGAQRQSLVWQYAGMPIDDGQVSAGACPTQEMVDAYEVLNDDGSESTPLLDLANPYNADGSPNISQKARDFGYVDCSDKMYLNRDPRFYATIYYDGVTVKLENSEYEVETFVGGNCGLSLSPSSRRNTCTGYYLRKFNNASRAPAAATRTVISGCSVWPNSTSISPRLPTGPTVPTGRLRPPRCWRWRKGMTVKWSRNSILTERR